MAWLEHKTKILCIMLSCIMSYNARYTYIYMMINTYVLGILAHHQTSYNICSPLVSCDADGCRQRFPHCLHKMFKLSIGHKALLLVIVLKELILFDNVGIARSPALQT